MTENRQILVQRQPVGLVQASDFTTRTTTIPQPGNDEILVSVKYVSLDPAYRLYMEPTENNYLPYAAPGDVMFGYAIGEVLASNSDKLVVGDVVEGTFGWQEYAVVRADDVLKRTARYPLADLLSVLGITGMTAYQGICTTGNVKSGETVLVSSASGAVGSIAAQIAKIRGARVIGIAGGPEKCRWLIEELGLDGAIDYKAGDLAERIREEAPEGIDLYFDNVGGEMLATVTPLVKIYGRIIICGFLGSYSSRKIEIDLPEFMIGVIVRELQLFGIHAPRFIQTHEGHLAEDDIARWLAEGSLKAPIEMRKGLDALPEALLALFRGEKLGKMMVQV